MRHGTWFSVLVLVLALFVALALVSDVAHAQGKKLEDKKGMDALGSKKFDAKRLPGKKEYALTVFSIIACVVVMKLF